MPCSPRRRLPPSWTRVLGATAWALGVASTLSCRGKASVSPDRAQSCERVQGPGWTLQVFVQPGDNMNPDPQGNPLDTQLRFYQLKGSSRSGPELPVTQLWTSDAAHLGDAVLQQTPRVAYIGRPYRFELKPDPKATHLLTVALLRTPVGQSYLQELELPLRYLHKACREDVQVAPPPCLFVLVEDNQLRVAFEPPPRFDRRAIPKGACATKLAMFPPVPKIQDPRTR